MQCFVMLLCRVQSAISQRFDYFFDYRWLELNDLSAHGSERAPPTHNVAVRPIIIFALTFKARNSVNRVPGADFLVRSSISVSKNRVFRLSCLYLNSLRRTIPCRRFSGPEHSFSERRVTHGI